MFSKKPGIGSSEFLLFIALAVCVTLLKIFGDFLTPEVLGFFKWLAVAYISSRTIVKGADIIKNGKTEVEISAPSSPVVDEAKQQRIAMLQAQMRQAAIELENNGIDTKTLL